MTQRRELKKYAKQAMSGKYGTLILAFVVVQALALSSSMLSSALFPGEETLDLVLGYAFTFILTLLILWKEKMSSPRRKAASSSHYSPEPSSRRPAQAYPSEKEVDEIMEKISRSGLSSLTEEEREILRRASRR